MAMSLIMGICGMIDEMFGNNINLDSICVLAAMVIMIDSIYVTYKIGMYAYRIKLDRELNCFVLTVIISVVIGLMVFIASDKIIYLFSMTDAQYVLFNKCLKIHAITIPLFAVSEFLGDYLKLKCQNKTMIITEVMFYSIMLLLDLIVFLKKLDLSYLMMTTFVSRLIYSIILLPSSKIFKATDVISVKEMISLLKDGCNILLDRITGKIALLFYNSYASKLGTEAFAIHGICYSLAVYTEYCANSLYDYQLIRLKLVENKQKKFKVCLESWKRTFLPTVVISYITAGALLLVEHGEVSLSKCIIPFIMYCSQIIWIQLYENMRGYLTSADRSDLLRWAGLIGIAVRVPYTLICYYTPLGLMGFALGTSVDYLFRGMYYYLCSKRISKVQV